MIHPLLTNGRILFVEEGCPHCSKYKKFIFEFNKLLILDKRIKIIDCSKNDFLGITNNPIITLFAPYFDSYPALFIDGEKKEGANTIIECKAWLKTRLSSDFIFPEMPEFFQTIGKYSVFDQECKYHKGRLICK